MKNLKIGFVISMYDEIDIVNHSISCFKKNKCKVVVIQSNPGNKEKEVDSNQCDKYDMLPDVTGGKENYLKMREKDGTDQPYIMGAIAIPRNYNKGFNLMKSMDLDYVVGINGDTKITNLIGIKKIIKKMKKLEKIVACTRYIGFITFDEQGKFIDFQNRNSTQIMPQFFIVDNKAVKEGMFCNIKTTNKYSTEQCMGDEIIRFAKKKSKGFLDIVQIISRSPYPRNIEGVSYNPEQVSKMPEFLELLVRWVREQNGEKVNMILTRITKIVEKFMK
jgi:hypothetical protein